MGLVGGGSGWFCNEMVVEKGIAADVETSFRFWWMVFAKKGWFYGKRM